MISNIRKAAIKGKSNGILLSASMFPSNLRNGRIMGSVRKYKNSLILDPFVLENQERIALKKKNNSNNRITELAK